MKTMNRKIPVILVLMLLTGSLVNAHSPQYSEKLRLGPKKIFSRVQEKSGAVKVGYNRGDERLIGAIAPGALDDPYGYITTYGYDGFDRISRITDPLNNITLIGRANTGNLLSLKQLDSTGQQILFQSIRVDDPGRLSSYTIKMPDQQDITYTITYEDNGKRIIFKDPLERQTIVQKNDDGKVDTVTDAAGNSIKYYYEDGRGNVTKKEETVKSADGTKTETYYTEYKYNAHNQVETITDLQTQAVTTFYYDEKGNLTGTLDAEGNSITHEYDELSRRTKTKQHFSNTSLKPVETTFEYYPANTRNPITNEGTYSPSNRLKSITDDKGNKTTYEYDYQNRLKKIIYPDNTYTEYTYDKSETETSSPGKETYYRLVIEKQRNDTVVKNYYDQLQRLMKREIIPAEGVTGTTIETFTYDELSRIKHATDDDTTLDYQFDRASRLDWEKQAGKLLDYTYNKLSNLTDLKYPNTKFIEREYDQLDRMNLIKEGTFTIADMTHIGRSYRLLRKQYGNGDLITYLYDQGRRLEYLESKNKGGGIINHYRYGYNKINLKTFEQRLHNAGKGDVFGYDALYRLTNVKFNATDPLNPTEFERERSIDHDNLHNIIRIVESFNGQTRSIYTDIPEGSDYSKLNQYARFDQWGLEYDRNGNLKQKGTQRFTYDYRNQLVSVVDGTLQVEMKYDVMGRRVQKAITKGTQTDVRNFYYSGHQLIEERDGNDQVTRQYIYGSGIDEIIRMDKYEGTAVTSYYFHTDSIGSVTAITNSQGNLVERVTYDTYGMPTFWDPDGNVIPESLVGNTFLFQGREYEPELNLYYYRARYYDPIMGRFLQTDPMGYADSMNLYQGFGMNPINFVDPFGLDKSSEDMVLMKNHWSNVAEALEREKVGESALRISEGGLNLIPGLLYWMTDAVSYLSPWNANQDPTQARWRINLSGGPVLKLDINEERTPWKKMKDTVGITACEGLGDWGGNFVIGYVDSGSYTPEVVKEAKENFERGLIPNTLFVTALTKGIINTLKNKTAPYDPVWKEGPGPRGELIEKRIGQNLPQNYPVIDRFENGVATSIKSMDLTLKSLLNTKNMLRTAKGYINKVADFKGARWARVAIRANEIIKRGLDLAIPRGVATAQQKAALKQIIEYGKTQNVKVNIIEI